MSRDSGYHLLLQSDLPQAIALKVFLFFLSLSLFFFSPYRVCQTNWVPKKSTNSQWPILLTEAGWDKLTALGLPEPVVSLLWGAIPLELWEL